MQVRRDKKMPVALLQEVDKAIISQAYPVFEIKDTEQLIPDYLMMWFSREEFDREACFYAIGGVRGSLEWEDFCDMKLPIPSPDKQKEIIKEYNVIINRISLNNQIIQKLEATAQAIYKQWFIDFEFPDENGNPYKSSGGEMGGTKMGLIPIAWRAGCIENIADQFFGYAFNGEDYSFSEGITVLRGENVTEKKLRWDTHKKWDKSINKRIEKCFLSENDIVVGMDGSKVGKNWSLISEYDLPLLLAQRVSCLRAKVPVWQQFIYYSMDVLGFEQYVSQVQTGTSVPHISGEQIFNFPILIPTNELINNYSELTINLLKNIVVYRSQIYKLEKFGNLLLSKLAAIEN